MRNPPPTPTPRPLVQSTTPLPGGIRLANRGNIRLLRLRLDIFPFWDPQLRKDYQSGSQRSARWGTGTNINTAKLIPLQTIRRDMTSTSSITCPRPDLTPSNMSEIDNKRELASEIQQLHHLENVDGSKSTADWNLLLQDAIEAEQAEKALGWKAGVKQYPKAIFWSFAISLCIVM